MHHTDYMEKVGVRQVFYFEILLFTLLLFHKKNKYHKKSGSQTLDIDFHISFSRGLHSLSTSCSQSVDNLWIYCIYGYNFFILLGFMMWESIYPHCG